MKTLLLAAITAASICFGQEAQINTSDIENFWQAYDASEPGNRAEAFQRLYFDQGSPGLKDFVQRRIESAQKLADAVERYPKYYASIRKASLSVETQRKVINLYLSRFRGLYPDAQFPPIYFLIGRLSSGGTTSENGLLIGVEVFSLSQDADTSELQELNPAFLKAMGPIIKLPLIVTHELVHSQIRLRTAPNIPQLLLSVLVEGAADLVANLVAGRNAADFRTEYGQERREELFERFAANLAAAPNVTSNWLYNYGLVTAEPADLGYWIGEEICRDYLARATDRQAAINNLNTLLNPAGIVRGSSYAYLLP